MAAHIPDDKINQVKHAADIVAVISESVLLKKRGKNFLGLCPFHNEKTPSFTVSPDKQIYYCFGCGEGGNVFRYLMKQEGLSFPEAVGRVARQHGIDLPKTHRGGINRPLSQNERLLRINTLAQKYYRHCFQDGKTGTRARAFVEKRGFSAKICEQFQVGYAPPGWDNIKRYLTRKGIPVAEIETAGLIVKRKSGEGHYDRFRERIMFPIFQVDQRVIGFGGRVFDDALPKYMNSPETPVYHKSRTLYGLHSAKNACRTAEAVFIVEGYFDLLAMHQYGFPNSVATLGTALSSDHVQLLKKFIGANGTAILLFDADDAGIKAAKRSLPLFDESAIGAKVMVLPDGHDPDSFLKAQGAEVFAAQAENAYDAVSFLIKEAQRRHGQTIEGRLRTLDEMLPIFKAVDDPVRRTLYINHLADQIEVAPEAIRERLHSHRIPQRTLGSNTQPGGYRMNAHISAPGQEISKPERGLPVERKLMAMLLQYPEGAQLIRDQRVWEYFEHPVFKRIALMIDEHPEYTAVGCADLIDQLDDEARNVIAELALLDEEWTTEGCRKQILQYIENQQSVREKSLIKRIKDAETQQDHALLLELLSQKQRLAAQHQGKRKYMAQGPANKK